jgi:hypothetical protein
MTFRGLDAAPKTRRAWTSKRQTRHARPTLSLWSAVRLDCRTPEGIFSHQITQRMSEKGAMIGRATLDILGTFFCPQHQSPSGPRMSRVATSGSATAEDSVHSTK